MQRVEPFRSYRMLPLRLALGALLCGLPMPALARADEDPVYDGKKAEVWIDILQNDASARKRALAATALGELRNKHRLKDLHKDLGRSLRIDSSVAVRVQCATVIAGLRAEDVKEIESEIIEALKAEKESRVRKELVVLMGRYPDMAKRSISSLVTVLKDTDASARAAAADAIAKVGGDAKEAATGLLPLIDDSDKGVRHAAIFALGRIEPDNASFVAAAFIKRFGEEKDAELRRSIIVSLKLLGDKSEATVAALASWLNDPDGEVRSAAASCLGSLGTAARPAVEALLKVATGAKDKGLRIDALRAFGSALGPGLKDRLKEVIRIMESDADFEVRLAAVEEIGSLGSELKDDKDTIAALRKRQSDQQVKVREAATAAIRRIEKKPEKPAEKKP
jgi:HEAT repeat protein